MRISAVSFAAVVLIGGFSTPFGAVAADLDKPRRERVERRVETRAVRREGPLYVSAMVRRCTTRVRREWRDERWQLRSAQICPGQVPDPFLAVGSTSIAFDPQPGRPIGFRVVSGY